MTFHGFFRLVVAALTFALGIATALAADTKAPPRTINDITALLDQYKPDPSKAAEVHRILDMPVPDIAGRKDLARFYKKKAMAAQDIGAAKIYVEAMRRVVDLGGDWDIAEDLSLLADAESAAGNLQQAISARQKFLALVSVSFHPGKAMNAYGNLATIYAQFGEFDRADEAIRQTEDAYSTGIRNSQLAANHRHTWRFSLDRYKALLLLRQGKLQEAEVLFRSAQAVIPEMLDEQDRARLNRKTGTVFSDGHMLWRSFINQGNLAIVVAKQGRLSEAELLARTALTDCIKTFGRYSYYTAESIRPYVQILLHQGRYTEAQLLAQAGLDILRQVGTPDDSIKVFDLRSDLGVALVAQRRYSEALTEFKGMYETFANLPAIQAKLATGNIYWALALTQTGGHAAALNMLDGLAKNSRQWLGTDHADTAILEAARGMALARSGQHEAALKAFRGAQSVVMAEMFSLGDEPSPLRLQTLTTLQEAYLRLLGEVHSTPLERTMQIDAANEAFRIADLLRGQSTQQAVVASAVRAAANDPLIGKDIRKVQDLQQELSALYRILRDLVMAPPEQQLPKVMAEMQGRIEALRKEQKLLESELARKFPAYANLIRPLPPSLADARAVLRPNEALLNIFTATSGTYVWAMRNTGTVSFAVMPLNRDQISDMAVTLRKALDPGEIDIATQLPRYDLDVSYKLYAVLLEPVAAGWKGADSILVAANGGLGQLPFGILPTAKSSLSAERGMRYSEYAAAPWLIRQVAITQLPSVNALVVLRRLPPASADRTPFIGFGDPLFGKTQLAASSTRKLRNLKIERRETPLLTSVPPANQAKTSAPQATEASAEWFDYSEIPPLPDTREEILSLAATLKADAAKDVFLGTEASAAKVKQLDLSRRRIVAFATHGLLPGDFPGVSEPSLALANPNNGKHGLLTLEDILGLKLNADWVILSACNTAAGDGSGADAVSGLGRGFFYAGSRALLVTHWPVESVSARLLVTGVFDRQAKDAALSRAQALRLSMLELMTKNSGAFSYAHPLFWAPYALVGDGGN